jgi:hypothetical protein
LIGLILLGPTLFSIQDNLFRDSWSKDKTYNISYSDGEGHLNIDYFVRRYSPTRYEIITNFLTSSEESVSDIGMTNITLNFYLNGVLTDSENEVFTSPRKSYEDQNYVTCGSKTVVKLSGIVEAKFNSSSIVQNETISYSVEVTVISNEEVFYEMYIPLIWTYVGYFAGIGGTIIGIILVSRKIGSIPGYTSEMKKRDEKIREFLKNHREQEE